MLELDFDEISTWFQARGGQMPHISIFPKTGFIVNGIAAGFVYFTDSPIAIIDCYVSNPDSDPAERGKALDLITDELIKSAKFHRCTLIKCDTQIEVIKLRAKKHGFNSLGSFESFGLET